MKLVDKNYELVTTEVNNNYFKLNTIVKKSEKYTKNSLY